jgi:histone-lysine N-methyltransferase SETMAR
MLKQKSSQSSGCTHIHQTSKNAGKLMATVFWDRKGLLMVEFMQRGTTILSEVYCNTKKLHRVINNKRCGMLTSSVVLLHANARPYTAARTLATMNHFKQELCDYPPYGLDLTPSYYHLFTYLKNWLRSQHRHIEIYSLI